MKQLSAKGIVSGLLLLLFCCLASSGALLYFGKAGMVMGIARHTLREAHFWAGACICVLIPVHVFLNRRLFRSELKSLRRKD